MKELIIGSILLIVIIFILAGIDFSLNPFHLRFTNPWLALGVTFIIIGILFIYHQGHINGVNSINQ